MRLVFVGSWLAVGALLLSVLARAEPADGGTELVLARLAHHAGPPPGGYLPDPPPLTTRHQWIVDLGFRGGAILFGGARRVELAKPSTTPRAMGRFALELYVGKELIDRTRFDFPLLGADELEGAGKWDSPVSFERNLSTRAAVILPHSERATRAILVDRATGYVWALPWPFPSVADAGAGKGG
jgi:hypothetical protein